ncbi:propanediol utilization protein [Cereibacter sphaeroides]|nr:propanediol utilization protein [Cereibacter sphaeroides]
MPLFKPRPTATPAPVRVAGHFGELLQGRLGATGPLALISLPCPALWVQLDGMDAGLLGPRRVEVLCRHLGLPEPKLLPSIAATMPPGGGAGSSTAALVAIARWLGFDGTPAELARACAAAEGASDPLMMPDAERLLFAPRQGRVLEDMPVLPPFTVVGGFFGAGQRTDPEDEAFPDIDDLVEQWRLGPDLAGMARLASESARRTLAKRGPANDPTAALAEQLEAAGWMIAHTGSARGLIYPRDKAPRGVEEALQAAGFAGVLRFDGGGS